MTTATRATLAQQGEVFEAKHKAFVLVETVSPDTVRNVAMAIRQITGVLKVAVVSGPFDLIVTVAAGDIGVVERFARTNIQTLHGVVRTTTCIVTEEF